LDRAKLGLHDLIDGLTGNEIGLVLFAGSTFVLFPLTTDASTAQTFLEAVSTRSITQQGTAIEAALQLALDSFDEQSPAAPIIVLATDGENHEGRVETVTGIAAERGVTIHTLGYGAVEGVPIPVLSDDGEVVGYKADGTGEMILSRLDETTLRQIADQTGGIYQRAGGSGTEITNLIRVINQAEAGMLDSRLETRTIERFGLFILCGIIALTFEMLAAPGRNRASL
jgi:Ca-activated chloride channel family protein